VTSRLMSCHLEILFEFSDGAECPALSAEAAAQAEAPRGPCGDTDSARSFSLLRFWPDTTGLSPAADARNDPAGGAALPAPGLADCAFILSVSYSLEDIMSSSTCMNREIET